MSILAIIDILGDSNHMILVRAPLRISFVGGGTDLPDFYSRHTGRVISATIDKFVYVLINPTPLLNKFIVKYQKTEAVDHPAELEHTRVRAALTHLGLTKGGLEIGTFADLPAKTGLGSSSSFSVALMKGLHAHKGEKISKEALAESAAKLEIELVKEPIGKQDQYAASFGGFNIFEFNGGQNVKVEPVFIDYQAQHELERHIILFFTGITRPASSILGDQQSNIKNNVETYKKMAESVHDFKIKLIKGDVRGMAEDLHRGWQAKKTLAPGISNSNIDDLYDTALKNGVWGGKVLGAGGGGCLFVLADPKYHSKIITGLETRAKGLGLTNYQTIPVKFVKSGTDILLNNHAYVA